MLKDEVSQAIEKVRPMLQQDGGDISLLEVKEDGTVVVELQGRCGGCPMSQMTLKQGVEQFIKGQVPGVTRVVRPEELEVAGGPA